VKGFSHFGGRFFCACARVIGNIRRYARPASASQGKKVACLEIGNLFIFSYLGSTLGERESERERERERET